MVGMGRDIWGRKGKGVGERSMVWIACMVGVGREGREGVGKGKGLRVIVGPFTLLCSQYM